MPLAAGTRFGPYEISSLIGAGGMGDVYKARDTRLDRMVAIKVLPPALAPDPERRRRFEQEARAVAGLSHPHICVLHDIGSQAPATDSQPAVDFLVMEYLEGETLAARLGRTDASAQQGEPAPLSVADALDIGAQIADALGAAHRRGIIHRDVKPANVMLTPNGVKLLDFGLAKLRDDRDEQGRGASALTTLATLTAAHRIVGTVPYMAPEQLAGDAVDARTDVFALGCVLYEMLTGRRAFQGESTPSVMAAILTAQPAPPSSLLPDMPPVLEQLVSVDERRGRDHVHARSAMPPTFNSRSIFRSCPSHNVAFSILPGTKPSSVAVTV